MPVTMTLQILRFRRKVNKNGPMPAAYTGLKTRCHIWTGACSHGYGCAWFNGRLERAHRLAYILKYGSIGSLYVLHHCDTPACVNPDHLFIGLQKDNAKDRQMKGRGKGGRKSRLDAELGSEIRLRYENEHISQLQLGIEYGVSRSWIGQICRKESKCL